MRRLTFLLLLLSPFLAQASDVIGSVKTPVKTTTKTDVQVQLSDQAGTNLANILANNTADPGGSTGGLQVLIGNVQSSAPSYTSGRLAMPWIDTSGRLQVVGTASGTAGAPNIVQLSDGAATYTGAKTAQLPAALGQTTMAGSMSVAIASDQSTVPVSQGAPTGAANAVGTQVTISSAATTAIACAASLATSTKTKLYRVRVSGAANARCIARYNNNGSFTNFGNLMTSPNKPTDEILFPSAFAGVTTGTTGNQQWEVNCTNFDSASQDWNVDCSYCIGNSGC